MRFRVDWALATAYNIAFEITLESCHAFPEKGLKLQTTYRKNLVYSQNIFSNAREAHPQHNRNITFERFHNQTFWRNSNRQSYPATCVTDTTNMKRMCS